MTRENMQSQKYSRPIRLSRQNHCRNWNGIWNGLETTKLLAASGATLSLADIQQAELEKTASELNVLGRGRVIGYVDDVSDAKKVGEWINKSVTPGKIINKSTIAELSEDHWEFVFGVNLRGIMHCMRAQINVMRDAGSIVNASSVAGGMSFARNASYPAAKHGVIGLPRTAVKEFGD
ncbi:hypothetical protein HFD88_001261 [Aspergillus terreus]|nr:hypothetical protein HFD88_001261 [Aspergillus terreus]